MTAEHVRAGAYRPGPLGRNFARVPFELITSMRARGLHIKWAVLLSLLAYSGEEEGVMWASCPRAKVCGLLGISERQAGNAAAALVRDGLLSVIEAGHNGRATVYRVNVPDAVPTSLRAAPTSPEIAPTTLGAAPTSPDAVPTVGGAGAGAAESWAQPRDVVPTGRVGTTPGVAPNRTLEEGSISEPSSRGMSTRADGPREGAHKAPAAGAYRTELKPVDIGLLRVGR